MSTQTIPVFLVGVGQNSFRQGTRAKISGLVVATLEGDTTPGLCFEVEYEDGVTDLVQLHRIKSGHYRIIGHTIF